MSTAELTMINADELNSLADANRMTVAIYLMHSKGFEGLKFLSKVLAGRGHQVFNLLAPECSAFDVSDLEDVWLVEAGELASMSGTDIFFVVDNEDVIFPKESVVVGSNHTYWEDIDPEEPEVAGSLFTYLRKYDAFLHHLPSLEQILEVVGDTISRKDFYPRELYRVTNDPFYFVPAGYLNLDALAHHAVNSEHQPEAILYAPTAAFRDRALADAEPICRALLKAFPDMPLIFRPHPGDILHFERFRTLFSDYSSFELDLEPTNRTAHARAKVVVTDTSSTGHSFSLSRCRPMVRASLKPELSYSTKWDFGFDVAGEENLIAAVHDLLDNEEVWMASIDAARGKYVMNPVRACEYVADHIELLAKRQPGDDWFALARQPRRAPVERVEELVEIIREISADSIGKQLRYAMITHAKERFPESELVADLAWEARLAWGLPWLVFDVDYTGSEGPRIEALEPEDVAQLFERGDTPFVIWGVSGGYRDIWRKPLLQFNPEAFLGFIDKNPDMQGTLVDGHLVHAPEAVPDLKPSAVIVASAYGGSIRDNLLTVLS